MSLGQSLSIALVGLTGHVISVEVDIADGLPGYSLLGLPDAALMESRDRVRSALVNSGEVWPNKKLRFLSRLPGCIRVVQDSISLLQLHY